MPPVTPWVRARPPAPAGWVCLRKRSQCLPVASGGSNEIPVRRQLLGKVARILDSIEHLRQGRKYLRECVGRMSNQSIPGGDQCGSVEPLGGNLQQAQRNCSPNRIRDERCARQRQFVKDGENIAGQIGRAIRLDVMRLAALSVAAEVEADHLMATVIQGLDPAEVRIVVLEADGIPVEENGRVSGPVDFLVNSDPAVLKGGHGVFPVDAA